MQYKLLDYKHIITEFISYIESNYNDLLNVEVKTRATLVGEKFKAFISEKIDFIINGSSASGIDLPIFNTDIKCTSINLPQSSSPYKSIEEKLFGLDYNILLFIYSINDNKFKFEHCVYIPKNMTGCKNATKLLKKLTQENLNKRITKDIAIKALKGWFFTINNKSSKSTTDFIKKFINNKLTVEKFIKEVETWIIIEPLNLKPNWDLIWEKSIKTPPLDGMINYSFALQWRLQYSEFTNNNYPQNIEKIK